MIIPVLFSRLTGVGDPGAGRPVLSGVAMSHTLTVFSVPDTIFNLS